jgi:hypothetical protein
VLRKNSYPSDSTVLAAVPSTRRPANPRGPASWRKQAFEPFSSVPPSSLQAPSRRGNGVKAQLCSTQQVLRIGPSVPRVSQLVDSRRRVKFSPAFRDHAFTQASKASTNAIKTARSPVERARHPRRLPDLIEPRRTAS